MVKQFFIRWLMGTVIRIMLVVISVTQTAFCADIIVDSYTKVGLPPAGTAGRLARVTDDVRGLWMDSGAQWFGLNGEVVNVKEFGAVPNDGLDDTNAIRGALTAAGSSKAVFIPAGSYKLTAALDLLDGQSLLGVGDGTELVAYTNGQSILNLKGSQIQVRGLFLRINGGVTGVTGVYINPLGNVQANYNKLHNLMIGGNSAVDLIATGILIQAGDNLAGDMGAWYNSLVDINIRYVTDGVKLTTIGTNLSNGANGTCGYNVRVGDSTTGWRITRADTAKVFGFSAEGCGTGIYIEDSAGADNNDNVFVGSRFESNTTDIYVAANSFYNAFIGGSLNATKITDNGGSTTFLGSPNRVKFIGYDYSVTDAVLKLSAFNGVQVDSDLNVSGTTGSNTLSVGGMTAGARLGGIGVLSAFMAPNSNYGYPAAFFEDGPGRGIAITSNNFDSATNTGTLLTINSTGIFATANGTSNYAPVNISGGGLAIGGGTPITKHLSATATWDPPNMSNGTATGTTVTVSGAALGDTVVATFSNIGANNVLISGHVQAINTVRVVLNNHTGGTLNLGSGTVQVDVWKH